MWHLFRGEVQFAVSFSTHNLRCLRFKMFFIFYFYILICLKYGLSQDLADKYYKYSNNIQEIQALNENFAPK